MMEDDMKRNGSGYYDETPVKTGLFSGGPQPGEIWETKLGKEYLILKNRGAFCNVLALHDTANYTDPVEVVSRSIKYTNPALMCYCFNTAWPLAGYIKTIPEEQYLDIMQAVGERLGVIIRVSGSNGHNLEELATAGNEDLLGECARLECRIEEWEVRSKALEVERDMLKDNLKDSEEMYHLACKTCNEEKAAREAAEATAANIHNAYTQAEEKAAMWEKMYNALLDRLFARGEAK